MPRLEPSISRPGQPAHEQKTQPRGHAVPKLDERFESGIPGQDLAVAQGPMLAAPRTRTRRANKRAPNNDKKRVTENTPCVTLKSEGRISCSCDTRLHVMAPSA